MLVHFPIVFFSAAAGFDLLFLGTGNASFELTAWYCLWGGALFAIPSIATGLLTWWLNYNARFLRQVIIKLILSPVLLLLATALIIWRYLDPGIMINHEPDRYLYLGGVLAVGSAGQRHRLVRRHPVFPAGGGMTPVAPPTAPASLAPGYGENYSF